jgi:KDO2-lipid IV(A) lauroyltransferase
VLDYLVYKVAEFIAKVLPYPLAYAFAVSAARIWFATGFNVGIIKKNISRVLNLDIEDPQVHKTAVKVFTNWGKNVTDFMRHQVVSKESLKSRVSVEGLEYLDEALKEKKGVVILSSHIGNFEWGACRLAVEGYKIWGVSLFRKSERMNRFFEDMRLTKGLKTLYINKIIHLFRHLKNNEIIAVPSDWAPTGKPSRSFKLFGRRVELPTGALQIALRSGAPLVPSFIWRDGKYTHHLVIRKPIELDREGERDELIAKNMDKLITVMEIHIREHITEWELFHDIWID